MIKVRIQDTKRVLCLQLQADGALVQRVYILDLLSEFTQKLAATCQTHNGTNQMTGKANR